VKTSAIKQGADFSPRTMYIAASGDDRPFYSASEAASAAKSQAESVFGELPWYTGQNACDLHAQRATILAVAMPADPLEYGPGWWFGCVVVMPFPEESTR
jgi:hypothetical protein